MYFNDAPEVAHDSVGNTQAQAGSEARSLGREEWIENFRQDLFGNAGPAVCETDPGAIGPAACCDL